MQRANVQRVMRLLLSGFPCSAATTRGGDWLAPWASIGRRGQQLPVRCNARRTSGTSRTMRASSGKRRSGCASGASSTGEDRGIMDIAPAFAGADGLWAWRNEVGSMRDASGARLTPLLDSRARTTQWHGMARVLVAGGSDD